MEEVIAYKATDDSLHMTKESCEKHNSRLKGIKDIDLVFCSESNPYYLYGEIRLQDKGDLINMVLMYEDVFKFILKGE